MSKRLTTLELIDLVLAKLRAYDAGEPITDDMRAVTNLNNACTAFAIRCFKDLQKIHKGSKERGLTAQLLEAEVGKHHAMKIITYSVMGRIIVTLKSKRNGATVSIIGAEEGDSKAGLQSIDAEVNQALDMLEVIESNWYTLYDKRGANDVNKFKESKNVSLV